MNKVGQSNTAPSFSASATRRVARLGADSAMTILGSAKGRLLGSAKQRLSGLAMGACLLAFIAGNSDAFGQSRFDQIRTSVSAPSVPGTARPKNKDRRSSRETCRHGNWKSSCHLCEDDDDQSFADALFNSLVSGMISSAIGGDDDDDGSVESISYSYDEETFEHPKYFAHYPYADGYDGYLMADEYVPARPQTGAVRFRFNYTTDFDDIALYSGSTLIESSGGWGIDGEITFLTEALPNSGRDELYFGDVNVLYRIGCNERAIIRAGVGANWLHDSSSTDFGINGTVLLDVFPHRPWTWTSQLDAGRIGSTSAFHLETSLGYSWEHIEIFGGFDYRRIGTVDLAGPMFGVRGWW